MWLVLGISIFIAGLLTPTQGQLQRNFVRGPLRGCTTPDGYNGHCLTLSECPQVTNVFQATDRRTAANYIITLQRSCGTRNVNGDPVICCTRILNNQATEASVNPWLIIEVVTPSTTTTTKEAQFVYPSVEATTTTTTTTTVATPNRSGSLLTPMSSSSSCTLPLGDLGVCKHITNCEPVLSELIEKQRDAAYIKYVKVLNSICGRAEKIICCPAGNSAVSDVPAPRRLTSVEEGCGSNEGSFFRIVGGEPTKPGTYPWMALLGYDGDPKFKCGGTLISARHVLTAAHCELTNVKLVRLAEHDLSTETDQPHIDVSVVASISHPSYNRRRMVHDIGLLYLAHNVQFSRTIRPICLPTSASLRSKSFVGYTPFVAGWGKTQESGTSSNILQHLSIPVLTNEQCRDTYAKKGRRISEEMFGPSVLCAGHLAGGNDTCQGDSGGPMMIVDGDPSQRRYYQIGIVSYGIGCARRDAPGVYTNIQYFMGWIIDMVDDESWLKKSV